MTLFQLLWQNVGLHLTGVTMCYAFSTQLGMLEEAINDCTEAIKLDDQYQRAYQRRAKWWVGLELESCDYLSHSLQLPGKQSI